MECPSCQHENREGRRFCVECGVALPAVCPACGYTIDSGDKFCGGCGKTLSNAPDSGPDRASDLEAVQPPPSREGERRQATIVFSDLSGFMAMNENLDPEKMEGNSPLMGYNGKAATRERLGRPPPGST